MTYTKREFVEQFVLVSIARGAQNTNEIIGAALEAWETINREIGLPEQGKSEGPPRIVSDKLRVTPRHCETPAIAEYVADSVCPHDSKGFKAVCELLVFGQTPDVVTSAELVALSNHGYDIVKIPANQNREAGDKHGRYVLTKLPPLK